MKYTLISMFSVNMILKTVISASAALMWSLIHVLQVFRYILMININMPQMIEILMGYLAVVIGEVDEMENMVPDWFGKYLVNLTDLEVNMTLYQRFQDHGYDSPFVALLFSKQMTILFVTFLMSLPAIYIGIKFMKNIKFIHSRALNLWTSFWWNAPLRTFTELFIEISLAFFLNSLNIKLQDTSGIIVTTIMFAVGLFVIFWPFVVLNIVCAPPKLLKKHSFNEKYGTLTEDFYNGRTLYQKAYYPLFVFQRLIITAILVMLYDTPQYQIILIFFAQLAMIVFVIKYKPFKNELQQVVAASDEFTIIFGMAALYNMWKNQNDPESTKKIGMVIIGIILAAVMKNMSVIIYKTTVDSYAKFKKWAHKKIGHNKLKRRRLREEAKKRAEKERIKKEDDDLYTYGICIDPADAIPGNRPTGRIISYSRPNNPKPDIKPDSRESIIQENRGKSRESLKSANSRHSVRSKSSLRSLEKLRTSLKKISQENEEKKVEVKEVQELQNSQELNFERPKIKASVETITYEEAKANQVSLADLINGNSQAQNHPESDRQENKNSDHESINSSSVSDDNSQEDSNDDDTSEVEEASKDQNNKWNYQPKKSRYDLDINADDYLDPITELYDEEE